MADPKQTDRPISVTTPLGPDKLLLIGISGQEAVSRLFRYQLDVLAKVGTDVPFDKLLGQGITATIQFHPKEPKKRYLNGICCRVSEDGQDGEFTTYHLEIVPKFWLASRKAQSRIFQQMSVPDILKKVLDGYDATFELQGTFEKRDYCVQYRETDFNFACRLMEEEGIYFFFKHSDGSHKMVVANTPQSHSDVPDGSKQIYETVTGGNRSEDRVYDWHKLQELRSGKYLLWDHTFELPHKHLDAQKTIQDSVSVGKVTHKLKVGGNDNLELYDYPGEYAQRFDGVSPGGGDQASELQKIFQDNSRTVGIRMEEEAAASIVIQGASTCRQLVSGHKFTLERHFNANGQYLLTSVSHSAVFDAYRSDSSGDFHFTNQFTCMPFALPFRPARITPKPVIHGTQTAVVVGPPGEEIWPDKYGRIKVQVHWDREGKNNEKSSCWIRVATPWAGKQWGQVCIPRIGQEVIVAFQEGDPDQPIIVGSVYNYEQMPPFALPAQKTQSGIKSHTHKGGGFNELVFDDTAGKEQIRLHGQYNMNSVIENNETHKVGVDRTRDVGNNETITVGVNKSVKVGTNHDETIGVNQTVKVGANQATSVAASQSNSVGSTKTENVGMMSNEIVGMMKTTNVGVAYSIVAGAAMNTAVGFISAEEVGMTKKIIVGSKLEITVGASKLVMEASGKVTIEGTEFLFSASGNVKINGAVIDLN